MQKKKTFKFLLTILFCLTLATPAQAGRFFVGAGVGTLGVGADVGYQFSNWLKVRLNANYLPVDISKTFDDIEYDAELRNFTAGLLMDIHPFFGEFRITAGAYYRDLEVKLNATPQGSIDFGGTTYSASDIGRLEGKVTWDKFAPYVGIGWGLSSGTDMDFSFDLNLGVMALRGTKVEYKMTGPAAQLYPNYQQDMAEEAQSIKDDINKIKIYPVLSLLFSFRF